MATRSLICIEDNETGEIDSIYCHYDGYIEHNGKILNEHYNTLERVRELISHGDISTLKETIDQSTFYHRDRSEDLKVTRNRDIIEFNEELDGMVDYVYIFRYTDNAWKWFVTTSDVDNLKDLTTEIEQRKPQDEYELGG